MAYIKYLNWVLLGSCIVLLTVGTYNERISKTAVFALIGTFFLIRLLKPAKPFFKSFFESMPLNKAIYCFLGVAVLSTLFGVSAYESQKILFNRYIIYFFLFFAGAFIGRKKSNLSIIILALTAGAVVVSGGGLFDLFSGGRISRLHSSFGYLVYGTYFLYTLPFFIGFMIFHPSGKIRLLSLAASLPVFAAFMLHGARGVWLGLIFSLFIAFFLFKGKRLYLSGLIFLLLAVIVSASFTRQRIVKNASLDEPGLTDFTTSVLKDSNIQARLYMWQAAININKKYPLLGAGPGSYGSLMQDYYPKDAKGLKAHLHAHSTYFETLADMGILGFLSLLWIFVLFFSSGYKATRQDRCPYKASFLIMFSAVAVSEFFMSVILVGLIQPAIFWLLLGLGASTFKKKSLT